MQFGNEAFCALGPKESTLVKLGSHIPLALRMLAVASLMALTCLLCACSGGGGGSGTGSAGDTTGPAFSGPAKYSIPTCTFANAVAGNNAAIDLTCAPQGCVWAKASNRAKLKLQVLKGGGSYNFDLPNNGKPAAFPLTMGNGTYTFRVMQNTGGNNYVQVLSTSGNVKLKSEFAPFLQPNIFCSYTKNSPCVVKAHELAEQAENEGDFVRLVYDWITANVTYDTDKAARLSGTSGYIPNPDDTFSSGTGICFDYASLGAAMMRSQGIPCKIMTGYVSPDGIYHSWNMIYIDGTWTCAEITVRADTWERVDLTFAASKANGKTVGDGQEYTDRYTY